MSNSISIDEASAEQLRAFADSHLGISIHPNTKLATARAKIAAAWGKPEIPVDAPQAEDAPQFGAPPPAPAGVEPVANDSVRIILQRTDDVGGDEPVPVGVNGRVMLVPRGKEVEIPLRYFEVLKNAVTHRFENLPDGMGINPIPREVPLFPHQRIA